MELLYPGLTQLLFTTEACIVQTYPSGDNIAKDGEIDEFRAKLSRGDGGGK